jgi:hypothetical protein
MGRHQITPDNTTVTELQNRCAGERWQAGSIPVRLRYQQFWHPGASSRKPPRSPPPEGEWTYGNQPSWMSHASMSALPAVALRLGERPAASPVGAQIVGPLFEDDTAITFAKLREAHRSNERPPL